MGAGSSTHGVLKRKVLAVGKLEVVRQRTIERRKEQARLRSIGDNSEDCVEYGEFSGGLDRDSPVRNGSSAGVTVTDTSGAWDELRRGKVPACEGLPKVALTLNDFKRVTRKKTLDSDDVVFDVPYEVEEQLVPEKQCYVCGVFTGHEVYPCRICYKSFHKSCLQKLGRCQDPVNVAILHAARSPRGWTCYICDDISNLLTEEELFSLMDTFDKYDVDKDASISLDEFLAYRMKRHKEQFDEEMPPEEIDDEKFKFNQIDQSKTGTISWWEFLNYESIVVLQRRNKSSLVTLLSRREIELARRVFRIFDKDQDGEVTPTEARTALNSWYSLFYAPLDSFHGYAIFSEDNESKLDHHIHQSIANIMDADDDNSGSVSWEEFLKDQAIYILATRPNRCLVPMGKKSWILPDKKTIPDIPSLLEVPGPSGATDKDLDTDSSGISE